MKHRSLVAIAIVTAALLAGGCGAAGGSAGPQTAAEAAQLALAQQDRFSGIGPRDENLIGQAAWYEATTSSDGWEVIIRIGWGDCPAGCISEHRWIYAVGSDGSVELVRQEGDPLPEATGVQGTVSAGPICPVVTEPPQPGCEERVVVGAVLTFTDAGGTVVTRTTSGADGTFAVELAPGTYRLTAEPVEGLMGTPAPMEIEVEAGQPMTEVQVSYDTGIR